jgi:ribosomal protein S27AE
LDKHNGERVLQYCSNCRDYFAVRHEQNAAVGIGTPASSPNDSQASEECSRCGKVFRIAQFQKRLANGKIRVLKSCQSCREIRQNVQPIQSSNLQHPPRLHFAVIENTVTQQDPQLNNINVDPDVQIEQLETSAHPFIQIPKGFISEYRQRQQLNCG